MKETEKTMEGTEEITPRKTKPRRPKSQNGWVLFTGCNALKWHAVIS
jgi:hypothetical protein